MVTPPGSRTPPPRPAPPPIPAGHRAPAPPPPVPPPVPLLSVATQAPVAGPSSYRPVEIPGRGTPVWKLLIAAALVVAVLGVAATVFFLNRRVQPAETAAGILAVQPVPENAAAPTPAPVETPSLAVAPPPASPRQAPAPVPPSQPSPADEPATESEESAASEEEATTATYTPPAAEPEPALAPREEMGDLASDLQARSLHLLEVYQTFLEAKDEEGREITDDDEQLEEDIEALADAAETFNDQLGKGGFLARRRQRSGEDIIRVQQRARELARRGERVEALMDKVGPGPEVRQGWQDVRRRWRRVAEIASGLR